MVSILLMFRYMFVDVELDGSELSEHKMMITYKSHIVDGQTRNSKRIFGDYNI